MDKNEIIERLGEIAKHAVHTIGEEPFIMSLDDGTAVYEAINIIQQSQPQSHWIPCSERLPEEDTDILVTYVDGEEARIIPVNYGRGTWFDCIFNSALDSLKVIAWMPLPEPYQEVG